MNGAFTHVSLLIDVPHEPWRVGPQAYLATEKPFPKRSRVLVHESMHYWHQICHGYLLSLGQEDWGRMRAWEQGGAFAPGPLRDKYGARTGRYGVSPHDLCECLARFWEVLFVGPDEVLRNAVADANVKDPRHGPSEELKDMAARETPDVRTLDMAMELSGEYAKPYLVVRHAFAPDIGPVLFPFLVHFALKTPRPVEYFERFVAEVAPQVAARITLPNAGVVEFGELATALYPFVREQCEAVLCQTDQCGFFDVYSHFADGPLNENPAYAWSLQRTAALSKEVGQVAVDAAVCIPIVEECRHLLSCAITPPCVRFADGTIVGLSHRFGSARANETPAALAAADTVANECRALQERWDSFNNAKRTY